MESPVPQLDWGYWDPHTHSRLITRSVGIILICLEEIYHHSFSNWVITFKYDTFF